MYSLVQTQGKKTMPQAISFGKQMVEGGRLFDEGLSSEIKHYFRYNHKLKISAIPEAWDGKCWNTAERTKSCHGQGAWDG